MEEPAATLTLWDYRRRMTDVYRRVRAAGAGEEAWRRWGEERDALFRDHPQSALEPDDQTGFGGLVYYDYDPAWRLTAEVLPVDTAGVGLGHSGAGSTPFRRFGRVRLETGLGAGEATLLWLEGYGGGVFLPFRDATNGSATYGGGRYLLDTAKGADLGWEEGRVVLDFNYAYHPSCVYSSRWSCPLAPPENRLPFPIEAGERLPA